jgi:hypothetical protein
MCGFLEIEDDGRLTRGRHGDDWRALYFTSRTHLGSVNLKIAGIPVPAPKRS